MLIVLFTGSVIIAFYLSRKLKDPRIGREHVDTNPQGSPIYVPNRFLVGTILFCFGFIPPIVVAAFYRPEIGERVGEALKILLTTFTGFAAAIFLGSELFPITRSLKVLTKGISSFIGGFCLGLAIWVSLAVSESTCLISYIA